MKCQKCVKENLKKANYCRYCGQKFTSKEKKKARYSGFDGFLRKCEKWYKTCTLKIITDNIWFKVISILCLFFIGCHFYFSVGNEIQILNHEEYQIQYNENRNEYYLFYDLEAYVNNNGELFLSMFIPNKINKLSIAHYDSNDSLIEKKVIDKNESIVLNVNNDDTYYIIGDSSNNKEEIKLYVYLGD